MKSCKRCLYTEMHPLNIVIGDDGLCSGCLIHEEKDQINWEVKKRELEEIFNYYRNKRGTNYDCIVPVTGGRDSYFIVHTVKNVFGMNPLLVTYNKHYNTAVGFRNLANLRVQFDCDIMTLTVDPAKVKKITRATLRRFGSIYWHCIAGQTVFPVQVAVKFKIPLIIWGAHQGIDQVGMFSHHNGVEMTRKYRKEHDLMGFEAEDLLDDEYDFIRENDILPFVYPDDKEIEQIGVRGIYLNNFIRWDSRSQHEEMIEKYSYETSPQTRTFDYYNDVDCWLYNDVHDYLKLIKQGFGKVVDHACREIRLGHLNRETALELVSKYMFCEPVHLQKFLNWLGITHNAFDYIIDEHRNRTFWKRNNDWSWQYLGYLSEPIEQDKLPLRKVYSPFINTPGKKSQDEEDNFILIGKGK
jgi:N-acetyl sugar amidotransferase